MKRSPLPPRRTPLARQSSRRRAEAAARIRGMKAAGHQAPSSSLNLASLGDLPRANGGPVASGQVVIIGSGDPELFVPCPTVFVERTPLAQDAFDARRRGPQ